MSDSDGLFPATELEHVDVVVGDGVEAGAGVNKRFRAFEPAAAVLVPPSYDPRLMVRVLLYGYCVGVRSSRELERVCVDVVALDGTKVRANASRRTASVFPRFPEVESPQMRRSANAWLGS